MYVKIDCREHAHWQAILHLHIVRQDVTRWSEAESSVHSEYAIRNNI